MSTLDKLVSGSKKIIGATLLSAALVAPANAQEKEKVIPFTPIFGGGLSYDNRACSATVPEVIRNVPVHPKDAGYAANAGPIKDSENFKCRGPGNSHFFIGVGYKAGFLQLRYLLVADGYRVSAGDINLRNYTNNVGTAQRGFGAALTYYKLDDRELAGLGYSVGVAAEIMKSKKWHGHVVAEYGSMWRGPIEVETGWDRFDKLEAHKTYNLFNPKEDIISYGIEFGKEFVFLKFSVSQVKIDARPTDMGKLSNFSFSGGRTYKLGFIVTDVFVPK